MMKKVSIIFSLVVSLLCFAIFPTEVLASDLTDTGTDDLTGWIFVDGGHWHPGTSTMYYAVASSSFQYISGTTPFATGEVSSVTTAMDNGISVWSGASLSKNAGSSLVVQVTYQENIEAYGGTYTDMIAIAVNETMLDQTHKYYSNIILSKLFFRTESNSQTSSSYKTYVTAHEIGHVFGFGHDSSLMTANSGGSTNATVSQPLRYGMMLLNHTHSCSNYGYDQNGLPNYDLAGYHKKRCGFCKSYVIVSHSAGGYQYNSSNHWKKCSCGYYFIPITSHTESISWVNSTTHRRQCTANCGYGYNQSHTYSYDNLGLSGHRKYCRVCDASKNHAVTEAHDIIYSGGIWRCSHCSYIENAMKKTQKNTSEHQNGSQD